MKLLSFASVSLVLPAFLGIAAAGDFNQQVEEAVVFYQQVENAKSIAIGDIDNISVSDDCSSCSGACMSIAGVVTCCKSGQIITGGKCSGEMSSDSDNNNNDSGTDDDTSESISGTGEKCMSIGGVKKCCSGTMTYNNGKFHCSGEMSSAKDVNPMWMGMLLMIGILVQLY